MSLPDYLGKSYHKDNTPFWTKTQLNRWKKLMCKNGRHLWDEVVGIQSHYLFCDGCGAMSYDLTIDVKKEDPLEEKDERV